MCSESTAESEPSYLTVAQLAQRLQVSESNIYGWVDRDYIPFLMAGDLVRFDPSAIHEGMLAEADRKLEKKRGLREVSGKVTPAPAAATGKEQSDDNPKTRNTLSLRFHDPPAEIQRGITRGPHQGRSRTSRDKDQTKIYERKYGKVLASIPFTEFVRSTYLPWSRANKRSSSDDEFHAKVFCHHFGNKSLSEIDHQMIEAFKIKRMQSITRYGRTRKPASMNRELAILSGIFRMAVDYDELPQNPCRKVQLLPENNQRTRHLSFEEEHRLFAEMTGEREYLRPLVTVAIYAEPRRGELLKLRWANVDFDLNTITFKETKTNKDRSVPMEPIVRTALLELRERAGDAEYVFVNPDSGTRYTDVKKSFSAACREAGIIDSVSRSTSYVRHPVSRRWR